MIFNCVQFDKNFKTTAALTINQIDYFYDLIVPVYDINPT